MMTEGQYSRSEVYDSSKGFRDLIGIILIVVGVVIALWAVINVYKIFTNPQECNASVNRHRYCFSGKSKKRGVSVFLLLRFGFDLCSPFFLLGTFDHTAFCTEHNPKSVC